MNLAQVSATLLTKNSSRYLHEVLTALAPFGEVLVYDTGSEDDTLSLSKSFSNVRIVKAPFVGFGKTHNLASAAAKYDWIFSIDSDEVASDALIQALSRLEENPETVYAFPRHNYFNGKFIKWCGWYPDKVIRLYNKTQTRFSDAQVHEAILTDGVKVKTVNAPIIHYSYASISDFLAKMQAYSHLFAEQNKGKKTSSLGKAIRHGVFAFFKSYFVKRGIFGGYEGFVISVYNGHTAYYKYLKLYEANAALASSSRKDAARSSIP